MMNRKERRIAAHKELKLARKARKAGLPNLTSDHGGADALVRSRPAPRLILALFANPSSPQGVRSVGAQLFENLIFLITTPELRLWAAPFIVGVAPPDVTSFSFAFSFPP
jgi:hypothetical protein